MIIFVTIYISKIMDLNIHGSKNLEEFIYHINMGCDPGKITCIDHNGRQAEVVSSVLDCHIENFLNDPQELSGKWSEMIEYMIDVLNMRPSETIIQDVKDYEGIVPTRLLDLVGILE